MRAWCTYSSLSVEQGGKLIVSRFDQSEFIVPSLGPGFVLPFIVAWKGLVYFPDYRRRGLQFTISRSQFIYFWVGPRPPNPEFAPPPNDALAPPPQDCHLAKSA